MTDDPWVWAALSASATKFLFRVRPDIPPCHTRIMRGKYDLPWEERVGIHCTDAGELEVKKISPTDNILPEEE